MIIGHGVKAAGRPSKRPRRGCILRTGRTKVVYLSAHTPRRVPVSRRIAVNPTEPREVQTVNLPSSEGQADALSKYAPGRAWMFRSRPKHGIFPAPGIRSRLMR